MNESTRQPRHPRSEPTSIPSLGAQLTELIEFVSACEAAARQKDRIDAVIRYGSDLGQ